MNSSKESLSQSLSSSSDHARVDWHVHRHLSGFNIFSHNENFICVLWNMKDELTLSIVSILPMMVIEVRDNGENLPQM